MSSHQSNLSNEYKLADDGNNDQDDKSASLLKEPRTESVSSRQEAENGNPLVAASSLLTGTSGEQSSTTSGASTFAAAVAPASSSTLVPPSNGLLTTLDLTTTVGTTSASSGPLSSFDTACLLEEPSSLTRTFLLMKLGLEIHDDPISGKSLVPMKEMPTLPKPTFQEVLESLTPDSLEFLMTKCLELSKSHTVSESSTAAPDTSASLASEIPIAAPTNSGFEPRGPIIDQSTLPAASEPVAILEELQTATALAIVSEPTPFCSGLPSLSNSSDSTQEHDLLPTVPNVGTPSSSAPVVIYSSPETIVALTGSPKPGLSSVAGSESSNTSPSLINGTSSDAMTVAPTSELSIEIPAAHSEDFISDPSAPLSSTLEETTLGSAAPTTPAPASFDPARDIHYEPITSAPDLSASGNDIFLGQPQESPDTSSLLYLLEIGSNDFKEFLKREDPSFHDAEIDVLVHPNGTNYEQVMGEFDAVHVFKDSLGLGLSVPEIGTISAYANDKFLETATEQFTHDSFEVSIKECCEAIEEKKATPWKSLSIYITETQEKLNINCTVPKLVSDNCMLIRTKRSLNELLDEKKQGKKGKRNIEVRRLVNTEQSLPENQKFLLFSKAGSYSQLKMGPAGSSSFHHVISGKMIFSVASPTKENIDSYVIQQSETEKPYWPGKNLKLRSFALEAGQTAFIPAGCMYWVYTPIDSICFDGKFLSEKALPMQFKMAHFEERRYINGFSEEPEEMRGFNNLMYIYIKFCLIPSLHKAEQEQSPIEELQNEARIFVNELDSLKQSANDHFKSSKEKIMKDLENILVPGTHIIPNVKEVTKEQAKRRKERYQSATSSTRPKRVKKEEQKDESASEPEAD